MPLSLTENFNNGMGTLTVVRGTWDADDTFARATVLPFDEPEALAVFKPGDSDYYYNEPVSDPALGSYAQFTIAAQLPEDEVGGVAFWLLSGGSQWQHVPAVAITTRRVGGIRPRYWSGSQFNLPSGWPEQWTGSTEVHDVIRAEIIGDECRVAVNGVGVMCFRDDDGRLERGGWHGLRIPHGSAGSGADAWSMGPLQSFTITCPE